LGENTQNTQWKKFTNHAKKKQQQKNNKNKIVNDKKLFPQDRKCDYFHIACFCTNIHLKFSYDNPDRVCLYIAEEFNQPRAI
jgi:hypothetical protein